MCVDLGPLGSYGCSTNQSVSASLTSDTESLSNLLSSFTSTNINTTSNNQVFNLTVGQTGFINCSPFNAQQTISGTVSYVNSVTTDQANQIVSQLQTDATAAVNAQNSQTRDLLSNATNSDTTAQLNTAISDIVSNSVTQTSINSVLNQVFNNQTYTFTVDGIFGNGGACNFGQTVCLDISAQNIVSNCQKTCSQTAVLQQVAASAEAQNKANSMGADDLVANVGNAVNKALSTVAGALSGTTIVIVIAIALVVLGLIFGLVHLLRGGGGKSTVVTTTSSPATASPSAYMTRAATPARSPSQVRVAVAPT